MGPIFRTDRTGHAGASTSTAGAQPSARTLRTDHDTSRASEGHNILPNPPKLPSPLPTFALNDAYNLDEALKWFQEELSRSIESSLGVQIKSGGKSYSKPYPSNIDYLKKKPWLEGT